MGFLGGGGGGGGGGRWIVNDILKLALNTTFIDFQY